MTYQIDQSGKIEQTNKDTILAISNDKKFTVLLKSKDKKILQEMYRNLLKRRRQYVYEVFSALLFILISSVKPKTKVFIDNEYSGHEDLIKLLVIKFCHEQKYKNIPQIEFGLIGKLSPAHFLGYKVFTKKQKPSYTLKMNDVLDIIFPIKKTGCSNINRTKGS